MYEIIRRNDQPANPIEGFLQSFTFSTVCMFICLYLYHVKCVLQCYFIFLFWKVASMLAIDVFLAAKHVGPSYVFMTLLNTYI